MAFEVIPLNKAYLCLDCELISLQSDICPKCTSKAMYKLDIFINQVPRSVRMLLISKPKFDGCPTPPPALAKK